jgi:hypothetical protein
LSIWLSLVVVEVVTNTAAALVLAVTVATLVAKTAVVVQVPKQH